MTDVLDQLINRIHDSPIPAERLMDAAADEIESLRAQLASAKERLEMCRNQYDAAMKRIDALQEELGRF
jgi:chromosome segregation ATPase